MRTIYDFLVWQLMQPFPLIMMLLGLLILNLWRKKKETTGRLVVLTSCYCLLFLTCFQPLGYALKGSLEWSYKPLKERPSDIEAIVVLSSSIYPTDAIRHKVEPDPDTLYRCLEAAEKYRQGPPCPVIVSGGLLLVEPGSPTNASLMRDLLIQLGVKSEDVILEDKSTTTFENAQYSAAILAARGIKRILLVTDAIHLKRAVSCFEKQGLDVVPSGSQFRATPSSSSRTSLTPNAATAIDKQKSLHEWLGWIWYWFKGRV